MVYLSASLYFKSLKLRFNDEGSERNEEGAELDLLDFRRRVFRGAIGRHNCCVTIVCGCCGSTLRFTLTVVNHHSQVFYHACCLPGLGNRLEALPVSFLNCENWDRGLSEEAGPATSA
jgi:hypothetical protein